MATPARPRIDCERYHTTLCVSDIPAAIDYYTNRLGFELAFTWGEPPTMAGVNLGDVQIFLEKGEPVPGGCALAFVISDADELHDFHAANGVTILLPPEDREYGVRDYAVRDPFGHVLSFGHYIYTVGPPVEIERVDVPVRLEKRLAALLRDLAVHKRMTVNECLEEILLHTCEPLGDGVASPHTRSQLRHIQQLRVRHGIDYDCHASYRFVEREPGASPAEGGAASRS